MAVILGHYRARITPMQLVLSSQTKVISKQRRTDKLRALNTIRQLASTDKSARFISGRVLRISTVFWKRKDHLTDRQRKQFLILYWNWFLISLRKFKQYQLCAWIVVHMRSSREILVKQRRIHKAEEEVQSRVIIMRTLVERRTSNVERRSDSEERRVENNITARRLETEAERKRNATNFGWRSDGIGEFGVWPSASTGEVVSERSALIKEKAPILVRQWNARTFASDKISLCTLYQSRRPYGPRFPDETEGETGGRRVERERERDEKQKVGKGKG